MHEKLPFWAQRRLQAPKCWFLAPSGARNQRFENPQLENSWKFRKSRGNLLKIFEKLGKNREKKLYRATQQQIAFSRLWCSACL